jgi:hypothetical protein
LWEEGVSVILSDLGDDRKNSNNFRQETGPVQTVHKIAPAILYNAASPLDKRSKGKA